jgi:hypothetical protein
MLIEPSLPPLRLPVAAFERRPRRSRSPLPLGPAATLRKQTTKSETLSLENKLMCNDASDIGCQILDDDLEGTVEGGRVQAVRSVQRWRSVGRVGKKIEGFGKSRT